MKTSIGLPVCFPQRVTPHGVSPGAIGIIFDEPGVRPWPNEPDPRVRVRIGNYQSPWVMPGGPEFVFVDSAEADVARADAIQKTSAALNQPS